MENRYCFRSKILLAAASAFALAGVVIAVIMMLILPSDYKLLVAGDFGKQSEQLLMEIQTCSYEEACLKLQEFCMTHEVDAALFGNSEYMQYEGSKLKQQETEKRIILQRSYGLLIEGKEYSLYLKKYSKMSDGKWESIGKILPEFAVILGALSFMAGICISFMAERLKNATNQLKQSLFELQDANLLLEEDMRREKQREQEYRDFFAAASHELKTPLTILKGELEGMIYQIGPYKDREAYLVHSLKTAEQMEGLIKEILEVSRVELQNLSHYEREIDLGKIILENCENLGVAANQKKIHLNVKQTKRRLLVSGDRRMWRKAVSNIIGNAVKHSPEGANVNVSYDESEFTVENSGIWIEKEQLKKIFQPFYRVDSSRSRETGGSGLGLYLVKQILEMYECGYQMENTENGIRFWVKLPQNFMETSPTLYQKEI